MVSKFAVAAFVGSAAAFSVHVPARPSAVQGLSQVKMMASPLAPDIWETSTPVKIQGQTLKTWDIGDEAIERVELGIKSDGHPVNANIELWHTPAYIPTKFKVYTMDGTARPVRAVIETPKHPKTVAVYNIGSMEFPIDATVAKTGLDKAIYSLAEETPDLVQGGKIAAYTFGAEVDSVQVLLKTDERNMKAKIELTQGPNQVKQVIELYASVGYKNPAYFVIQTPGADNALRVINENTVEFPFDAYVLPYETGDGDAAKPIMGGSF